VQHWRSKSACIGPIMTTSTEVWMSSLMNIMSICWKELNMAKGNTCSYFRLTWKLASCAMETKMSRTTSWLPMRSLPWAQHKRWIPMKSMGCVHTHQRRLAIEWCDRASWVWSVVKKIREKNWKVGNISRTISQTPTLGLKHDTLRCCWKRKVLLLTHVGALRRKGHWSTINLTTMIETPRPNSLNTLLKQCWLLVWIQCHQKLLGKMFIYKLEVFMNYRRTCHMRKKNNTTRFSNQNKNKAILVQNPNRETKQIRTKTWHVWNKNPEIFYCKEKIKKRTRLWQKSYPKLVLNKLKVMGNFTSIYTPWAFSSRIFFKKLPIYMWFMFNHVFPCAPMCELWMN